MGVNSCSHRKGVLMEHGLWMMLGVAVALFGLTGGDAKEHGGNLVGYIGEVLRAHVAHVLADVVSVHKVNALKFSKISLYFPVELLVME